MYNFLTVDPAIDSGPVAMTGQGEAMSSGFQNSAYWRSPVILLATLVSVAFFALALRTMFDPVAVSANFGLPMTSRVETSVVEVYGSRNLIIALLALSFIVARMSKATALVFTFAALLPLLDMWIIVPRIGAGPELIRHAIILVALLAMTAALWRRSNLAAEAGSVMR
jgi:hypothetical protein